MVITSTELEIPEQNLILHPGDRVRLERFSLDVWVVSFGWYSWGGNRPVCGWYLVNPVDPSIVKPLQLSDLTDIYVVEH